MKTCNDCKIEKDDSEYYLRKTRKGTRILMSFCKLCSYKRARDWQIKNLERYKEYHRQYHLKKKA